MPDLSEKHPAFDRETLIQHGFVPTRYEGQEGEYLTKQVGVENLPALGRELIDHELVHPGDLAIIEVCPNATVQFYVPGADLLVGREPVESNAARIWLSDAIAAG